ncbi:MAG: hypothetical protein HY847_16090 [Betaproteobacteria bacterium]|nr:hypothetical protein [Betaproteobacteria bacterium]
MNQQQAKSAGQVWKNVDGNPISCLEKIKVLNQNFEELRQIAQDALDDALLMQCSEEQIRQALHQMIDELHYSFESR